MSDAPAAFAVTDLGKRFGKTWALRDCTLSVPDGRIVALVGANGSGKSTLLHLLAGLCAPTAGAVEIAGRDFDTRRAEMLAQVGLLPQRRPLYPSFTVADVLRFGAAMNPGWDSDFARERVGRLGIPPRAKVRSLSGGQLTQVALTLALGKRPRLLLLDEPLSDLDPLARRDVMGTLMADVADRGTSVILSTHILADVEQTCDWLILLNDGQVALSDDTETLCREHVIVTGDPDRISAWARTVELVHAQPHGRLLVALLRQRGPLPMISPGLSVRPAGLEDVVLVHLRARNPHPDDVTSLVPRCVG